MIAMLRESMPLLLHGAKNTFVVCILSMVMSIPFALLFGFMRYSGKHWVRTVSLVYVEVWRGVPYVVVLLIIYFALPEIMRSWYKIEISPFVAMLVGSILWTSANLAEIIRGALQAIPFGQTEAAAALGMTYLQRMRLIILPQAVKIMIPPAIGIFTLVLKGSAIGFMIGYQELIRTGQITIERLFMYGRKSASIEIYTVIMIMYFLMCYPLTRFSSYFEARLTKGERVQWDRE